MSGFELVRQNSESDKPKAGTEGKLQPVVLSKFEGNVDQALQFYSGQVNKLTFENNSLRKQLLVSLQEKKELADIVAAYREQEKQDQQENKKRVRRCANEIQRNYICPIAGCRKSYGAEGSMAQHMKFKHPHYRPADSKQSQIVVSKIEESQRLGHKRGS